MKSGNDKMRCYCLPQAARHLPDKLAARVLADEPAHYVKLAAPVLADELAGCVTPSPPEQDQGSSACIKKLDSVLRYVPSVIWSALHPRTETFPPLSGGQRNAGKMRCKAAALQAARAAELGLPQQQALAGKLKAQGPNAGRCRCTRIWPERRPGKHCRVTIRAMTRSSLARSPLTSAVGSLQTKRRRFT